MRIQLRARRGQGWLCSSITPAGLALLQDQGNLLLMLQFQARVGKAEGKKKALPALNAQSPGESKSQTSNGEAQKENLNGFSS